jgi:thymidylate synthase (FAD)
MSFEAGLNPNVTKTRSDMAEYLDNVMAQGHGSVLEHVYFTFAINNVSRVFTGEMNRHRAGVAISERSMRYIRFEEDIKWWMPLSIRHDPNDDRDVFERKNLTRQVFIRAFNQMQENYKELCDIWTMDEGNHNFHYKKTMTSCFRRIIGMGAATGGVWTFNVRALRHMLTMRCSAAAEEEIQLVATGMLAIMQAQEPVLFGDFKDGKPKHVKV